jgi:hypothetical protein
MHLHQATFCQQATLVKQVAVEQITMRKADSLLQPVTAHAAA